MSWTRARVGHLQGLERELEELEAAGLLRVPPSRPPGCIDLCSNDYLGFAQEPWPSPALERAGAGGSRLVVGDQAAHAAAERAIAEWLGFEACLLFTSGYAANVGLMSSVAGPGDLVLSDQLNHASIIDGCRLSRAEVVVVPHLDLRAIEETLTRKSGRRRWVVTESLFSMDGDGPDLASLRDICDHAGAGLIVDEAHAIGVLGPEGRGRCAAAGVVPDALVGTAGKALGLQGAFVSGTGTLRAWLWNRARSFVFSTGVAPAMARAIEQRVGEVRRADERRRRVSEVADTLRAVVARSGAPADGLGPVVPWTLGSAARALRFGELLAQRGVFVQPIRPPTVPAGTSRLRLTASSALSDADLHRVEQAFATLPCFT